MYAYIYSKEYYEMEIPKKSGGIRIIEVPSPRLKKIQKFLKMVIINYIHNETSKNNKEVYDAKTINFAYKQKHGNSKDSAIFLNANRHRYKKVILTLDLENYFHAIHFGRVVGYLKNNKHFMADDYVAKIIANIAMYKGRLPQGGVLSPLISNFITEPLDYRLIKIARKYKCSYSRYADDITFSSNKKNAVEKLCSVKNVYKTNKYQITLELRKEIDRCGFNINVKKTRIQHASNKQVVTGLVVNRKINICRHKYKCFRRDVHFIMRDYCLEEDERPIKQIIKSYFGLSQFYIDVVTSQINNFTVQEWKSNKSCFTSRYVREIFLLYFAKIIVENNDVVMLVEGASDKIIYKKIIKHKKISLKVEILSRAPSFFKQIFKTSGEGTSWLNNFLTAYEEVCSSLNINKKFYHKPIFIVVDNDKDGRKVIDKYKNKTRKDGDLFIYGKINCFKNVHYIMPKKNGDDLEAFLKRAYLAQDISVQNKNNAPVGSQIIKLNAAKSLIIGEDTDISNLERVFEPIFEICNLYK